MYSAGMLAAIPRLLRCRVFVLSSVAAFSALALAGAYTAQYAFGLMPCELCLWQRVPFWAALGLALAGLAWRARLGRWAVAACAAVFAANAVLAAHHAGVEQHWWPSILESCALPEGGITAMLDAPAVPCDEVPWADPVLGLSMAAWNAAACLVAALGCALSAALMFTGRAQGQR